MTTIQIHGNPALERRLVSIGLAVEPIKYRPTQSEDCARRSSTRMFHSIEAAIERAQELNRLMEKTGGEPYRLIQVWQGDAFLRTERI